MGKISDLPVELLEYIFDGAETLALAPEWQQNLPYPVASRASFPLNVASTCAQWSRIMVSKPKYWRHVVIDVADDPRPFLDTLSGFKTEYDIERTITVFSSKKDSISHPSSGQNGSYYTEAKRIENARANQVFERLEGSILDYNSITFDLVYQSSLPSTARLCAHQLRYLYQLTLDCVIHDCDETAVGCPGPLILFHPLENLKSISLTGVNFMQLCVCGRHRTFPLRDLECLELSIKHFKFESIKQVWIFQLILSFTLSYATLLLSDLTLTCPVSSKPNLYNTIAAGNLVFDSVSSEFLQEFVPGIRHHRSVQILSFRRCTLPHNYVPHHTGPAFMPNVQLLQLIDIPCAANEDSILTTIKNFPPKHVRFLHCDNVSDTVLKTLAESLEVCSRMKTLELHYCGGFTTNGILTFAQARRDLYHLWDGINAMVELEVYGMGPLLSTDDITSFLAEESAKDPDTDPVINRIEWNVTAPNSIPDGYATDLRPANEVQPLLQKDSLLRCPLAQLSKGVMHTVDAEAYSEYSALSESEN